MGLLEEIRGRRVYLDTNVFIYAIEGFERFEDELDSLPGDSTKLAGQNHCITCAEARPRSRTPAVIVT